MISLVLTLIGEDRPGLVSSVARLVEVGGGSWQHSQMARLAGKFAGIALVEVADDEIATLEAALAGLAIDGLHVQVERSSSVGDGDREVVEIRVHLLGQDRPGIVAEISSALTAHDVGIDELTTGVHDAPMAGGRLFEVDARLSVPQGTDIADVRADLERLADELMVDLALDLSSG